MLDHVGRRASAWALLACCLTVSATFGAGETRTEGRFDHRVQSRIGGAIGAEALALEEMDRADPLRAAWQAFDERNGGRWKIFIDQRSGLPTLVSGPGIQWFDAADRSAKAPDLAVLEARARQFLAEQPELFGAWGSLLQLDVAASMELRPGHWQLIFGQVLDGIRVEGARLDLHIIQGRMAMLGASLWGNLQISTTPNLDEQEARKILDDYIGTSSAEFEQVAEPLRTIVVVDPGRATHTRNAWEGERGEGLGHALIWRLRLRFPGEPAEWVGEVDAHSGEVLAFYDDTHYASIRGAVFPVSNDGDCADGGCEIVSFPMPFADYVEGAEPEQIADGFGNMQCINPSESVATNLEGNYVRIADECGGLAEQGTCDEGLELGRKYGENCDVDPAASPGNSAAARTAFYHVNRIAETARFYDPTNVWLQDQLTVNVNAPGSCNAFWQNGELTMYAAGGGCGNTGEMQGVLVHEWGHGYDANDGGGMDITSEAYADVVAIFAGRDSCVSRGWYNDGRMCTGYGDTCLDCTGIRDHDWAARLRNTPTTPINFTALCPSGGGGPCARESHCESYPISEAMFDLATRDLPASGLDPESSWQLAERLWFETRPGSGGDIFDCFRIQLTHSCFAISWLQRMRAADDDDGDLSNGTPHAAALYAAFKRHGISCGSVSGAENQSTSSCPTLAAPSLTVAELPGGTDLQWTAVANASEYRVYRGDLGCDRQQVPIATVASPATGFFDAGTDPDLPRHYRIEAFGSNHVCQSPVSNCESTPVAARLQTDSHRVIEDGSVGDGDDFPEPGETIRIPVTLLNGGVEAATGVTGTLRLIDTNQGVVVGSQVSWTDLLPSESSESLSPHYLVAIDALTPCGAALKFEHDSSANNDVTRTRAFDVSLGEPSRSFLNEQTEVIPAETVQPVTSTLSLDQAQTISELDVSVRITHQLPIELIVELISPSATTVRLHNETDLGGSSLNFRYDADRLPDGPGSMSDFVGETAEGVWTLSIQDGGALSVGNATLVDWSLHVTVDGGFDCTPATCADPPPTEAPAAFTVDRLANGGDIDLVFNWGDVVGSAGFHVLQSTAAAFDSGVTLSGVSFGPTTLTLPNGANSTPSLTFFQVKAVNACGVTGP